MPRHLLPRDLDSSLEKVQKLVLKPVLYWIVGVDSSFSPTCLAADVPSVVPLRALCSTVQRHGSNGSAQAELSSCKVPGYHLQSSKTVQLRS